MQTAIWKMRVRLLRAFRESMRVNFKVKEQLFQKVLERSNRWL